MNTCLGQKPVIDSAAIESWPLLMPGVIADNGKYLAYNIRRANFEDDNVLEIINCENGQKKIVPVKGNSFQAFANRDGVILFKKSSDSLGILNLRTDFIEYFSKVIDFKIPTSGDKTVISYKLSTSNNQLVVRDLANQKEKIFNNVLNYFFNENGSLLILVQHIPNDTTNSQNVVLYNIEKDDCATIWEGKLPTTFVFDHKSRQVAFFSKDPTTASGNLLWLYQLEEKKAQLINNRRLNGLDTNVSFTNDYLKFSNDDDRLFLHLIEKTNSVRNEATSQPSIWKYNDIRLLSERLTTPSQKTFLAAIGLTNKSVVRLEQPSEKVPFFLTDGQNDDFLVLVNTPGDRLTKERKWNKGALPSVYTVSSKNGEKQLILPSDKIVSRAEISPNGKYAVYYSPLDRQYFSYEIATGVSRNLTRGVNGLWTTWDENDMPDSLYKPLGIAGWFKKGNYVLIYDQYDIWIVELAGLEQPVNLTKEYGRQNDIVFRLLPSYNRVLPSAEQEIILTAFNKRNKDNGFYSVKNKGGLKQLTMDAFEYDFINYPLLKAKKGETYVLRRMTSTQYPNYFVTTDFKSFRQLTYLQPQKEYNWLTAELIKWKSDNGQEMTGVLYKPENFDSSKKYPIIFNYYERLSDHLNTFKRPEFSNSNLNIPFFVSNGYLVFTPDIFYKIGNPLTSASNIIISAARYLSNFSWVNSEKMGLQGHSWGGYETNSVITQTNMFAAAMSAAGITDMISDYGSISHGGTSRQFFYELGQIRMGAMLWEKPDLYVKNSPIFMANQITTPLLMMHNREDGSVPFGQSLELFMGLRRLQKPVWLLEYAGEGHILSAKEKTIDFTNRVRQFFDHYLKDQAAPSWMQ